MKLPILIAAFNGLMINVQAQQGNQPDQQQEMPKLEITQSPVNPAQQREEQIHAMIGKPAPAFAFPDSKGKMHSLGDFKGKFVYLDIWASWCGPCKAQIPAAKELEQKFKGNDVVFLAVSIDGNEQAWIKCLTDLSPAGLHLIAKDDGGTFSHNYGVMTIPRYFIIDRDGNIIDADAKRPSTGAEADLEALLKK